MFLQQVCCLVFKVTTVVNLPLLLLLTSNFAALWVENVVCFTSTSKVVQAFICDPTQGQFFINVHVFMTTMNPFLL